MDAVAATTEHSACATAPGAERGLEEREAAEAQRRQEGSGSAEAGAEAASEVQGKEDASTGDDAEAEAEAQAARSTSGAAGNPPASDSSTDAGPGTSDDEEPAVEAPRDGPPSAGSAAHAAGECTPCCFFFKNRCRNGASCEFCHLPHEKRSRGRGCRGHGATKRERLQAPRSSPGLVAPPPGLELPGAEPFAPKSFLATRPPSGAAAYNAAAAAAAAYHQSMLLPEASSRHVSPAMALGLGSPAIALGLGSPASSHPQPPAAARLATAPPAGARRPPVMLATSAPESTRRLATEPPPPPAAAPRGFDLLDAASLPRLLGGTRPRPTAAPPVPRKLGEEAPTAAARRPPPEGNWGPVPVKVAVAGLGSAASLPVDPTAPIKKRVPDWAV